MEKQHTEPLLWRALRPTTPPEHYFTPSNDGILGPATYFTASAREAFTQWAREEPGTEYTAGKTILVQTPPRATVYQPHPETFQDYKKYSNTRAITNPETIHPGHIKAEIVYFYKQGAPQEEYHTTIHKDNKNRIQMVVITHQPGHDHTQTKTKIYRHAMNQLNHHLQKIYAQALKTKQPPLHVKKIG